MSDEERPGEREEERPRSTSRYSVWVGIAFVIVIAVASINTFTNDEGGLLGADAQAGEPLPEFAVPELPGGEDADANIFQDDCESSANPCPADEQRTPACEVELPRVLRVCDYFDRPLVLSFWFTSPSECPPTQDLVDDAASRFEGRVNFLSIAVRGEREELERIIRERGWSIPVGWDRDGAVSNLYRVGVCPTVALLLPGGILEEARIGTEELDRGQLDEAIEGLLREARERERATR